MAYRRVHWREDETALSADNMNNIEDGIEEALAATKASNLKTVFLNIFYPVGTYYETSNANFNPNTAWGGTWVKETAGRFLIAAGTGYATGSTGGEAKHTLTVSEMPSHTHTQNSHNHTQNSHNHTQNSHNHTQNSHTHAHGRGEATQFVGVVPGIAVDVKNDLTNQHLPGQGTYCYPWADDGSFNSSYNTGATVATNKAATATNVAATATNKAATATNQNTGGGASHNNIPPYKAVNIWYRTA